MASFWAKRIKYDIDRIDEVPNITYADGSTLRDKVREIIESK